MCSVSPPRGAVGWSMVCIYGVSRLYSLVLKLESRICDHVLLDLLNLTFENDKKNLSNPRFIVFQLFINSFYTFYET